MQGADLLLLADCSPMSRVVKVLWVASRARGKKTDRRQITGNDYTGTTPCCWPSHIKR